ncbi:linear amide C-N hydrolase, partial [Francisella tularensis subsp. holarctica]|uniref:linear amide C-N hydrolase n=1 Tax=Francisella tularensis TaxID=263 RepID=UPI002381C45C
IQPKRDTSNPDVNGLYWIRYGLGTYATYKEVLDNLNSYQIYNHPIEINCKESNIPFNYMVEDKTVYSELIEYINVKLT